ncbi:PLP-dependent transferase [Horticoccus luteus]|uniref:PLP-dependent transferase n=1 Tax=Horticoccus luteus TaxID=2862869 RepID=A0A8F9TWE1_9BACT|nr:PLP-dependent transferase [Horticoccus luteus]QYM79302.1 PLP-dependent transferase [Horticoccus luteus]
MQNDPTPAARQLSPRRKTTTATSLAELAREQLAHFHLDPHSPIGAPLLRLAERLYAAHGDLAELWAATTRELADLPRGDRLALFNAKKFLTFQLAKLLDTLQNPTRAVHQSLGHSAATTLAKGPYPTFDNVAALFSANPVITRTATYIFACTEWIDDAFQGREFLHEIYSRLLNPTSISLANHIVEIEAGPLAHEYLAWNFNSGMAAIDSLLAHLVGYEDVVLASRNVYGGTHQLLHDWYGKKSNLNVAVEFFDGATADDFERALATVRATYADRLAPAGARRIYVYLESPCNPHGVFLDVPAICRSAHAAGLTVILDATVGTPFLVRPLQESEPAARPDYVIHSYTKDLVGNGDTTAGVVLGRNADMFLPKGDPGWDHTLFWNVYYIKGAFLDADKAYEVLSGMKTLEMRMLKKCINTAILARWLASHPHLSVHGPANPTDPNAPLAARLSYLGLPAPLFTIDFEAAGLSRLTFERFFDSLSPMFGHMVSLGQSNTVILCPALTSHSELDPAALRAAGITPTTIRIAVGDEDPRELIRDFLATARLAIDPDLPGFSARFLPGADVDTLCDHVYLDVHRRHAAAAPRFATPN